MRDYDELFIGHADYVSQKWTHYPCVYDELLRPSIEAGKPMTVLEIGVQNGGSLQILEKYLPTGSQIHGVDIDPRCGALRFSPNIHFHLGNAADSGFIARTFGGMKFDLMIDDGSHQSREVVCSFFNLFPMLSEGGIYLIEDMEHSYYANSGGGFRRPRSSVEFFKRLVDALNVDHFEMNDVIDNIEVMNFLHGYAPQIKRISFYTGICAIEKYHRPKAAPFECVMSGKIEKVNPCSQYRKTTEQLKLLIDANRQMFGGKRKQ
ncbi:MAG: class I SAM-dependent methyltransferase [Candidatus Accumulibacter sp.]|jgi:cephalosporin hydroxylase|nr:class I SAM-dependent methyltransferase [Accumulibacter sp.]